MGQISLKNPKQIEVEALTENKGLWENLNNTKECEEILLRHSVALVKEMLEKKEVNKVTWVETKEMLADALTKRVGNSYWIKGVLENNLLRREGGNRKIELPLQGGD